MSKEKQIARRNQDTQLKIWNGAKVSALFLLMTIIAVILLFPYVFMLNKSLMTSSMVIDPTFKATRSVKRLATR